MKSLRYVCGTRVRARYREQARESRGRFKRLRLRVVPNTFTFLDRPCAFELTVCSTEIRTNRAPCSQLRVREHGCSAIQVFGSVRSI
jgi:hypothetical protein